MKLFNHFTLSVYRYATSININIQECFADDKLHNVFSPNSTTDSSSHVLPQTSPSDERNSDGE